MEYITGYEDIIGHIAYIFLATGVYTLGKGKRTGFILQAVGALIWAILGFNMEYDSILLWNIVFLTINIIGYKRWKDNDEEDKQRSL